MVPSPRKSRFRNESGFFVWCGRDGLPAADSACVGWGCLRGRLCLRAGTSDRCAPPVLSLPPLRGRPLPFTKPRAATPSEVPAHPAFPGRGTMLRPLNCRDIPRISPGATSIRKSGLEIKNRCTDCPCFDLMAASIRKSGLEIENRCMDCPCFDLLAASIRKSGLEIENRCSAIVPASRTARLRKDVVATMTRPIPIFVAAKENSSACVRPLPHRRTARLQRRRGGAGGDRMPRRRHNPK